MVQVRFIDIPSYLHRSAFYQTLDADPAQENVIEVPENCLWPGGTIGTSVEFRQYLQTLLFWGIDHLIGEGLEYIFKYNGNNFSVKHLDECIKVLIVECTSHSTLFTSLMSVLVEVPGHDQRESSFTHSTFDLSQSGLKKMLDFVGNSCGKILFGYAAGVGNLQDLTHYYEKYGAKWTTDTSARAAFGGHLSCLEFLISCGCPCDLSTCESAAFRGHVHILHYLHDNKIGIDTCSSTWPSTVCTASARGGQINCLIFLRSLGVSWNEQTCEEAVRAGQLGMLQFMHENTCPWDTASMSAAIALGNIDIFRYLLDRGCPSNDRACFDAVINGHVEILRSLREHGCSWGSTYNEWPHANWAAFRRQIDTLRYVMENNGPCDAKVVKRTLRDIRCLKYVIEDQLMAMDDSLFVAAFCKGDLECVRYLVEVGCPYLEAAFHKYPLDTDPIYTSPSDGVLSCLMYAVEHGWKPTQAFCQLIINAGEKHARCQEYLERDGLWIAVTLPETFGFP